MLRPTSHPALSRWERVDHAARSARTALRDGFLQPETEPAILVWLRLRRADLSVSVVSALVLSPSNPALSVLASAAIPAARARGSTHTVLADPQYVQVAHAQTRLSSPSGRRTRIRVARPGAESISRSPPASVARSCMLSMPWLSPSMARLLAA